eukprot:113092_1
MSTQTENKSKWNTLKSFPYSNSCQPIVTNNDELMAVAPKQTTYYSYGHGIYKFNKHKNEWIKIFDYDKNFKCNVYSTAYDNISKLLHICDIYTNPPKMLTFNLKTRNKVTSKKEQQNVGYFGLIFVENKLHKICE